jgi:hypothetical protein
MKYECGALIERYWQQAKIKILRGKSAPVPICAI